MSFKIGEEGPGGGLVFWVNEGDRSMPRALEAAQRGWYTGSRPWGGEEGDDCQMIWSHSQDGLDAITFGKKEIGSGGDNYDAIEKSEVFCAPIFQINSFMGGDWMLPTADELQMMYKNLHLEGLGDFDGEQYWSCTTFFVPYIYSLNFMDGEEMMSFHNMCFSLRPVRVISW